MLRRVELLRVVYFHISCRDCACFSPKLGPSSEHFLGSGLTWEFHLGNLVLHSKLMINAGEFDPMLQYLLLAKTRRAYVHGHYLGFRIF